MLLALVCHHDLLPPDQDRGFDEQKPQIVVVAQGIFEPDVFQVDDHAGVPEQEALEVLVPFFRV
ncbi:MAG: hypothetical protein ACQETR_09560, partial [Thermodesulfobacteriota bacterium]